MLSFNDRRRARAMPLRKLLPLAVLGWPPARHPPTRVRRVDAAAAPAGNFDFEGWDAYLGGADSSQYSSLEANRQEQRRPARSRLDVSDDRELLLQSARRRQHDVRAREGRARSSHSTPRRAASSGRTPTKAPSARAA